MQFRGRMQGVLPFFKLWKKICRRFVLCIKEVTRQVKRMLLLVLLLIPLTACALTGPGGEALPDAPLWQAKIRMETRLRTVRDMDSKAWLGKVPEDGLLDVYAVEGDWCICGYNGEIGYIPYDRLYQFYKLTQEPLPGASVVEGVATMVRGAFLAVEGYSGNSLQPGDQLCVRRTGLVPMMHDHAQLACSGHTYEPFVSTEAAEPGDALYGFTTFYNEDLAGRYPENRAFNIEEAARRLQGVVIPSGEKFSFNAYCGPYTEENGYKLARNISDDGYGYGGGVCQVSTTIFQAVQGLDVRFDEWYVHSYWGIRYVPRTLDAAVSSARDFSFYNMEPYAVEMYTLAQDGVLTVIFRRAE